MNNDSVCLIKICKHTTQDIINEAENNDEEYVIPVNPDEPNTYGHSDDGAENTEQQE